jgi:hypothetical protein
LPRDLVPAHWFPIGSLHTPLCLRLPNLWVFISEGKDGLPFLYRCHSSQVRRLAKLDYALEYGRLGAKMSFGCYTAFADGDQFERDGVYLIFGRRYNMSDAVTSWSKYPSALLQNNRLESASVILNRCHEFPVIQRSPHWAACCKRFRFSHVPGYESDAVHDNHTDSASLFDEHSMLDETWYRAGPVQPPKLADLPSTRHARLH